jgi:hypothetical protein
MVRRRCSWRRKLSCVSIASAKPALRILTVLLLEGLKGAEGVMPLSGDLRERKIRAAQFGTQRVHTQNIPVTSSYDGPEIPRFPACHPPASVSANR